jgi:hypothetical protein
MDVGETGYESMHWIHLAQDRVLWRDLVNAVFEGDCHVQCSTVQSGIY